MSRIPIESRPRRRGCGQQGSTIAGTPRCRRLAQRGSTMVVVMALVVALMGGGAVALYLQLADTRATALVRASRDALACAEAGLAAGRTVIGANYAQWPIWLDGNDTNNGFDYPITADLDDPPDGVMDYEVTIKDNDDELPPAPNDLTQDNDLRVFVVSKCLKFPETPRTIMELVRYQGGGTVYRNQSGQGSGNTGNAN